MAMTITKNDFQRIHVSLALAVLMIAIGAIIVAAALQFLNVQQKANSNAQIKAKEIQTTLSRAREEEQEIKQKIAQFNALQSAGIIGEEQRLDWVEQIRQIKRSRKLFDVQYEFAPQRPLDATQSAGVPNANLPTPNGNSGNFDFYTSTMQLQMPLLHEDDLLKFLADLRASVHAFIRIRSCSMERLPKNQADRSSTPQLRADCSLDWITIRERKGT